MILSVARSLGLNAVVRPVVEGKDHWYLLPRFSDEVLQSRKFDDEDMSVHVLTLNMLKPRVDDPTCESISGITWCNPLPDWQSVLNLVTTPVQVTAEVLQQKIPDFNNVLMQNQSEQSLQLKSAGIQDADIPVVLEALKRLQASSVHQVVGVHNIPGSHLQLYACYQMAVLLVDVPQWGLSPRIATDEVAGRKIKTDSQFDTENLLYWKK